MNHLAWRRAGLGALAAVTLGAALPAHAEGVVNVYTNREPGLYSATLDEFTKATGIKVNAIFSEQGLAERIKAEGENSPADVLITVDIGRLQQARRSRHRAAGALRGAGRRTSRPICAIRRAAGSRSRCAPARSMPRRSACRTPRSTYEDLADPKWKGKLCTRSFQHQYNIAPRRGFPRPARRGEDRGMAARRQGQPRQEAVRRRPRRGEGHRRRRLRHRPRQPVLCRPDDERRRRAEEMGRGDPCHPADLQGRRHACERVRRRRRQARAEPRQCHEARRVHGLERGPARLRRRELRVSGASRHSGQRRSCDRSAS